MDFRIKEDRSMNQREICDRVEIDSQDNKARYQSLLDWRWTGSPTDRRPFQR